MINPPDKKPGIFTRILTSPQKITEGIKNLKDSIQRERRTKRFVSNLFEKLIREEISGPHLLNTINTEAQKPSVLNLDTQRIWNFFTQRSIAYRLYGE